MHDQLVSALSSDKAAVLHEPHVGEYAQMNVANRDIKLENTFLDTSQPGTRPLLKVCEFGYSIDESLGSARAAVGTPGYVGEQALQLCASHVGVKEAHAHSMQCNH